jgi:SecD/SecF fusion protein
MVIRKKSIYRFIILAITLMGVVCAFVFGSMYISNKNQKGIEFTGGINATVKIDLSDLNSDAKKTETVQSYISSVSRRTDTLGISGLSVSADFTTGYLNITASSTRENADSIYRQIIRPNKITFASSNPSEIDIATYDKIASARYDSSTSKTIVNFKSPVDFKRFFSSSSQQSQEEKNTMIIWMDRALLIEEAGLLYKKYIDRDLKDPKYKLDDSETTKTLSSDDIKLLGYGRDVDKKIVDSGLTRDKIFDKPNTTLEESFKSLIVAGMVAQHYPKILSEYLISSASPDDSLSSNESVTSIEINNSSNSFRSNSLASIINEGVQNFKIEAIGYDFVPANFNKSVVGIDPLLSLIIGGAIAMAALAIFLIYRYRIPGLLATISLFFFILFSLLIFTVIGGQYSSDTIASLVIGIGIAVDANIVLFEKLREQISSGTNIQDAIRLSSRKTIWSIIDSNVTTLFVAFIMLLMGVSVVKGFGTMLTLSIVSTMIFNVLLVRLLMWALIRKRSYNNMKRYFGIEPSNNKPNLINKNKIVAVYGKFKGNFNLFNKSSSIVMYCSFALLALGIIAIIIGAVTSGAAFLQTNTDFFPGTNIKIELSPDYSAVDFKNEILPNIPYLSGYKFDISYLTSSSGNKIVNLSSNDSFAFNDQLFYQLSPYLYDSSSTSSSSLLFVNISPYIALRTLLNALYAILIAMALIIVYVAIRFNWTYSVGAIISLIHDALIIAGILALTYQTIDLRVVVAILAIIGYSINDTIITFGSIRSSVDKNRLYEKEELKAVVNDSVRKILTRSILTSFTTMISVVTLMFFGSTTILLFNYAMFIGLIFGTFSSLYIATKIWFSLYMWRINRIKKNNLNSKNSTRRIINLDYSDEQLIKNINS